MLTSKHRIFVAIILSLIFVLIIRSAYSDPTLFEPENIYTDFIQNTKNIKAKISSFFTLNFNSTDNIVMKQSNNENNTSFLLPIINQQNKISVSPTIIFPTQEVLVKPTYQPRQSKPTAIPTKKSVITPTSTPIPSKPIGLVRPGKNIDEVIEEVAKIACIPKPMLYAILKNESGDRYKNMSVDTFVLYNTYNWWNSDRITSIDQICNFTAFNNKTGIIPTDSKFAGEMCWIGDITDSMGPMSISSFVWNAYLEREKSLMNQQTIDRRVIFDALLGAALHLKNVSLYKGTNCDHWELKYVVKAACKYLSMCQYNLFNSDINYCDNTCNTYNQYSSTKLDCSQIDSVITNDCQLK